MQEWTGQEWIVPVLVVALALLTLGLLVLLARERARTARELRAAHAEAVALRAQVDEIERRLTAPAAQAGPRAHPEYVITQLGGSERTAGEREASVPSRVDGALFADLVLRETVVRAASLTHGLRRALAAETRHRIRFEVRRETRAARKQRRRDLRDLARQSRSRGAAADAA